MSGLFYLGGGKVLKRLILWFIIMVLNVNVVVKKWNHLRILKIK